jgi:hypothetical protein
MNTLEDRLRTALATRAEQVEIEDLGPLEVTRRHRDWLPAAIAAAVLVAAVASPFVFGALRSSDRTAGPAGPPPPTTAPAPLSSRPSEATGEADIDGDHNLDDVTLSFREANGRTVGGFTVTVDLAFGGTFTARGPEGAAPTVLEGEFYLPGAPHDILGIRQVADGSDTGTFFKWEGTFLVHLVVPSDPPLRGGLEKAGGQTKVLGYGVFHNRLYSWRVQQDDQGRPTGPGEYWKWRVKGTHLEAVDAAGDCRVVQARVSC